MNDVVLVFAPYGTVDRPSIGLGYLAAELKQVGIGAKIIHANVMFASRIGLKTYNMLNTSSNLDFLGEWTFSEAAFPDFQPNHAEYFSSLRRTVNEEELWRVRKLAKPFIDDVVEQILAEKPRIVGVSTMFQQNCAALALLRRVRERAPEVVTVLGGANCEGEVGRALHTHFPWVDYIFSGECDEIFPDFCRRVLAGEVPEDLPPMVFTPRTRSQGLNRPTDVGITKDLDILPIPDFDDYFRDLKSTGMDQKLVPALILETSRGCWWGEKKRCLFCGLSADIIGFRSKSPDNAYREIHHQADRYNIEHFELVDNILDTAYFDTLLPALAKDERPFKFFYEIKSNVTRRQVEMLADAGVCWVQPGIEGLNDTILKLLRKGNNVCHNLQVLKWCREYGIYVSWNYLYNVPGEQDEWHTEELDLIPLLAHLQAPWNSGTPIRFDRFSVYFRCAGEHNLELNPSRVYKYIYPLSEDQIREQAFFFENTRKEVVNGGREQPVWARLRELLDGWCRLFYAKRGDGLSDEAAPDIPKLTMAVGADGGVVLEDTRPCAVAPRLELDGLAARVYRICDTGEPPAGILTKVRAAGFPDATAADVEQALAELLASKTLVRVSGRYLSLAVNAPCRPYFSLEG
ncbi:MAG TPA: RiPP maturation radical SAM C-methyltransferase [Azospirillaceae bacterium]|nr:RiPP maturation radical SAM C-methyltransferase [Azospirillaceae bacterium]